MGKTKRILSFFIALIMVLALVPFNAIVYAVDVETGDEAQTQAPSVKEPVKQEVEPVENADLEIGTADELKAFAAAVNAGNSFEGKVVVLANDIDLRDEEGFVADGVVIGTSANPFKGTFDGQNHTISELYIGGYEDDMETFADSCVGLFGVIQTPAVVKNVTVNNPFIVGKSYVGGIVGMAYTGAIYNCHVTGEIDIEGYYMVGGITGHGYAKIENCSVIGDYDFDYNYIGATYKEANFEGDNVGGIVGHKAENTTIKGCTVANVTVEGTRKVGGIVGTTFQNNTITDCKVSNVTVGTNATVEYANANLSSMGLGGIIGVTAQTYTGGTVSNCSVNGLSFTNANNVPVSQGAITGGHRQTSGQLPVAPEGTTFSGNEAANVEGTVNSFGYTVVALPNAEVNDITGDVVDIKEFQVYLNGKLSEGTGTLNPQIVLEFLAKDTEKEAAESYYADFTTDFFITLNGIENADTTGCYLIGNYGEFGWIAIPLDDMELTDGTYSVITSVGFEFTYEDICTAVKDFKCGIYFTPEFLNANPNFEITLDLGLCKDKETAQAADLSKVTLVTTKDQFSYTVEEIKTNRENNSAVAEVNGVKYATLGEALAAAAQMSGEVTITILDKVTLNQSLTGNYTSIKFVGASKNAEIYLDVQGYIEAPGKAVAFEDLKLSKSEGGYITNAGFMNVAFGIFNVESVNYTNCTFKNGACASSGEVTFTECTFYRSHDKYSLWAYGDVDVTVNKCTFDDYRGIKMYSEGGAKTVDLTVTNTDFSKLTGKPAIVATLGNSITLSGNTYSAKGVLELEDNGSSNGIKIISSDVVTCISDAYPNGCGVIVDGRIYRSVAEAATVATAGSTVILLHNSAETVEFVEGVTLDKNGFTADGVTVAEPVYVAKIGDNKYETLEDAIAAAKNGDEVVILVAGTYTVPSGKDITITGAVDGVVFDNIKKHAMGGASVTFNNVTFNYSMTEGHNGLQHSGNLVYNNCIFNGQVFLYGTSETFNDCTFNQTDVNNYNVWTYAADDVEFNGCTFYSKGRSLLIYSEGADLYANVVITDCDFISSNAVDGKAAIEMDSSLSAGIKVTIDAATTATGFGNGNVSGNSLWNNKKGNETAANNDITVVVNGVTVLAPVTYVAQIGDKKYTSLQDAINAAQNGETVVLLENINGAITIPEGKNVTLDLNGYDIVGTTNAITNNGTLTINDTVGTGNVYTTDVSAQGRATIVNNGIITINGGWYGDANNDKTDRNPINRGNAIKNFGVAVINGGYFTNVSNQYIGSDAYAYAINTMSSGTTTINNATVYGDINGLIYSDGKTVVNYGSFTLGRPGEENNLWYLAYGDVEINGGTWTRAYKVPSWNTGDPKFEGAVKVSGGTFNVSIPEENCAEGFVPCDNGDGTYGVAKKELESLGIYTASLVASGTLQMNIYLDPANAYRNGDAYYMVITLAGEKVARVNKADWSKDQYGNYFVPVTVPAKSMTDVISAQLYDADGNAISDVYNDSVEYYARYVLQYSLFSVEMRAALVAMLNYGAETQKVFGYKTDKLANANISAYQYLVKDIDKTMDGSDLVVDYVNDKVFNQHSIDAASSLVLNLYYDNTYAGGEKIICEANRNSLKVTITYTNYQGQSITEVIEGAALNIDGEVLKVAATGLAASDIETVITVTVEYNGVVVSELTDSVEAYCATAAAYNASLKAACEAIVVYGRATRAYFTSINN